MNDDFAAFVQATGTQLYRTALLLTGDHHLAEDLTQATYAKAFASWLFNTFLSHKRLRRNSELPSDVLPEQVLPLVGPELRLDLLQALGLLAPADRAVLVARYWEDRSVVETAEILGISQSLVRTRARRALQRIRPLLHDTIAEGTSR
jgi:RNA polymerase sigma factor (sigma-70 family)